MGALSSKGGREQRNREEIGREQLYYFSPLVRPARQNRHARQANILRKTVFGCLYLISWYLVQIQQYSANLPFIWIDNALPYHRQWELKKELQKAAEMP